MFCSTYAFVHSVISLIWAIHIKDCKNISHVHPRACNVITSIPNVDLFLWLTYYFIDLCLWQIPFLYIIRPPQMMKRTLSREYKADDSLKRQTYMDKQKKMLHY